MTRTVLSRTVRRALGSTLGVVVLGTALMGFAHTPPGRPLLQWMGLSMKGMGKGAGCPLGYDVKASPEQREAARQGFAAAHRGAEPARARPSLGFTLDGTTREQVLAWAGSHGVKCTEPRAGADLECAQVPASLLGNPGRQVAIRDLWLTFGGNGTLISAIAISRAPEAALISTTFAAVNDTLAQQAGPPTRKDPDSSAGFLTQGALRQASAEYRFQDFYALMRATNMGDGFVLTEEYRSLSAPPAAPAPRG